MHTVCLTTNVLMEHAVHIINLQFRRSHQNEGDKNLSFTYLHTKNHSARKITSFTELIQAISVSILHRAVPLYSVCMAVTLLGAIFLFPLSMCFLRPQTFL